MILPVSRLSPEGVFIEDEDPIEVFDWPESPTEVIFPAGPLRYKLKAKRFGDELLVTGQVEARFTGICCRCGGPFDKIFGDEFVYSETLSAEITEVDLTSELRETIILSLPNNPVCSDGCLGVCPHCGKRLAEGACSCKETPCGNPFSELDSLFNK